ncbi:complexin-3-like [Bufo gargarizans]|uniref:complexin-3-like n=1 Tax=Bufo gargarizans TaxID=30331 RepID=UPI001CF52107|nr:complexin-3-like [Bufo gargarizans]
MTSVTRTLFGGQVKSMSCCTSGGPPQEKWPQTECRVNMRRWSLEEQNCRVLQPDKRRSSMYAQQKAERALMREHFREKYHLARNAHDQEQVRAAGTNVHLSRELRAIVRQDQSHRMADKLTYLRTSTQTAAGPPQPGVRCLLL